MDLPWYMYNIVSSKYYVFPNGFRYSFAIVFIVVSVVKFVSSEATAMNTAT